MELSTQIIWIKENILAILSLLVTCVFIYHYVIERDHGIKLSKKYRNSLNEVLSKIYLNATSFLISGNKELAIREFENALEINKESIDTQFTLARLLRSNGEIEKAIHLHRSLIARENITESARLSALKELAIDFDKGGLVDKAIETYKDVLRINRDQEEVIDSLCRIYENIGDWEQAYYYRILLTKMGQTNQNEIISQILVEKAKKNYSLNLITAAKEDLGDAFRFAPSVSAKILQLAINLIESKKDEAKNVLLDIVRDEPNFISFLFISLQEKPLLSSHEKYLKSLNDLIVDFLDDATLKNIQHPSITLARFRLLKKLNRHQDAQTELQKGIETYQDSSGSLHAEYIKVLIDNQQNDLALKESKKFFESYNSSIGRHYCSHCGFNSDDVFWRCPQCHRWKTIQFRWKV